MKWRPLVMTRLLLRFSGHCVLSGITTARIILQRSAPPAGLVRLRFAPMTPAGAAVLGAMVTLTPGSSAIDIDPERGELLLHLLDIRTADTTLATIRKDFEEDIRALFPQEAS